MLDAGLADAVIVGGVDTLCYTTLRGFHSLGVLAAEPCRPFASERPGMNIGEGAAFLLLEREGDARAFFRGIGESSDAFHMSAPHPEGAGAELAMRAALADAGLDPAAIGHVNAHGTGTAANDVAEAKAIEALFGGKVPVVSTKSYTGHTLGAGGATEAVLALLSMEQGFLPASLRASPLDPNVHIDIVTERRTASISHVMSNSFAFGGNNASVILAREA
jgi:3-oxoacyl-[acyl-carrier-protein] synthase-1